MKFESFDEIIDKVYLKWQEQESYAKEADRLMEKCEKIEAELLQMLKKAEELDRESYQEFLNSFKDSDIRIVQERTPHEN